MEEKKNLNYDAKFFLMEIGLMSVMYLFFFQLVTSLLEAIYMTDLLNTSMDAWAAGIMFILFSITIIGIPIQKKIFQKYVKDENSPLKKFYYFWYGKNVEGNKIYHSVILFTGLITVICRSIAFLVDTKIRIIIAGLGVGMFMIFFPLVFLRKHKNYDEQAGIAQGIGLSIAVLLSILFRTLNSSVDLSTYKIFNIIGWILGGIAVWLLWKCDLYHITMMTTKSNIDHEDTPPQTEKSSQKKTKYGKVLGLSLGIFNIIILLYSAFESPTVIARWTEGNYLAIITILAVMWSGFILVMINKPQLLNKLKIYMIWVWNGIFAIFLVLTILAHTIQFPPSPSSDPIIIGAAMWYQQIPLYLMLILSPIIFIDYILLSRELVKIRPTIPQLGSSFTLGGLYFIILIFIMIFTNIWDYVQPVSGYFRNLFWLPYLILGLGLIGTIFLVKNQSYKLTISVVDVKKKMIVSGLAVVLFFGIFLGGLVINARPNPGSGQDITQLTLMTYNIQQGVNETGSKNYDQQLEMILMADPDIIAFQESDCARVGLGNSDVIRYYADKLDYYSYWGPKTVAGTFGTAILSRYPIIDTNTIFCYSDGDEIGTAYVQIKIGDTVYNVFDNHPAGSGDAKLAHIQSVMEYISENSLENVISMGDFNSLENSTYYNASVSALKDTWLSMYPSGVDGDGLNMTRRIDHIFVSPKFNVLDATFIPAPASQTDHPVYWTTISW